MRRKKPKQIPLPIAPPPAGMGRAAASGSVFAAPDVLTAADLAQISATQPDDLVVLRPGLVVDVDLAQLPRDEPPPEPEPPLPPDKPDKPPERDALRDAKKDAVQQAKRDGVPGSDDVAINAYVETAIRQVQLDD